VRAGAQRTALSEVKHEGLWFWTFIVCLGAERRKRDCAPRIVPRKAKRTDVRAGV
jgi:hypothetical protein